MEVYMSEKKEQFEKSREAYQKIKDMPRSDIRYRLYRLRVNKEVDANDGIREYYEAQPGFRGFDRFAVEWDIGIDEERFTIKRRLLSELEEWEAIVRQHIT